MSPMLIDLIKSHCIKYPKSEVVDIYKLLFQAANGPRHLALDFDAEDFKRNWNDAVCNDFPPLESISADGELVRAHSAPLREKGLSPDDVINSFTLTAQHFEPHPELLIDWWKELGELIKSNILPFPYSQYAILDEEFKQWGFEAKHHSESFIQAYKPNYLIVLRKFIDPIIKLKN